MSFFKTGNPIFKAMAIFLIITFTWQELCLAVTPIDSIIDDQSREQSQTFAPAYLQEQQAIHESLISQKQDTEDNLLIQNTTLSQDEALIAEENVDLQGPRSAGSSASWVGSSPDGDSLPVNNTSAVS